MQDLKITGPVLESWLAKELVDEIKATLDLGGIKVVKATMSTTADMSTIIMKLEKE